MAVEYVRTYPNFSLPDANSCISNKIIELAYSTAYFWDKSCRICDLQFNIDNLKITLQFCGDIQWNHIIYDVNEWRLVSNKGRRILIVSQPIAVYFHQIGGERWIKQN